MNINEELDERLENAEVRNKIGEAILGHLSTVESMFYKIALSKNNALSEVLRKDINIEIGHVKHNLAVLENGGVVSITRKLNIANVENYTLSYSYYPENTGDTLAIESIDLLPKLTELEKKGK